nr:hypothetical protein [Cohaesibacter intestini]
MNGLGWARGSAFAAAGAPVGIDGRDGPSSGHEMKVDGLMIAMILTGAAHDAIEGKAAGIHLGADCPTGCGQDRLRLARLGAFPTEQAGTIAQVDFG